MDSIEEGEYSDNVELLRPDESRPASRMKAVARGSVVKVLALILVLYFTGNAALVLLENINRHDSPSSQITDNVSVIDVNLPKFDSDAEIQPVPPMVAAAVLGVGATDGDAVHAVPVDEAFDEESADEDVVDEIADPPTPELTSEQAKARARQQKCDELVEGINVKNEKSIDDAKCQAIIKACGLPSCQMNIDVVILWVNGSDPRQIQLRSRTVEMLKDDPILWDLYNKSQKSAAGENRFRDFGQLKVGLRSIEKNLPYARRIMLVTNKQIPPYINPYHPRIRIIDHTDLLRWTNVATPYPAMFNSMAIESMIHNIPTLSSPFIYMQDDMFFGVKVPMTLFIDQQGGVARPTWKASMTRNLKDALFYKCAKNSLHALYDLHIIPEDKYLNASRGTLSDHGPTLWFVEVGKACPPLPEQSSEKLRTWSYGKNHKIWEHFGDGLAKTVAHPFRTELDYNLQAMHMHLGRYMGLYWFKEVALTTFKILTANHDRDIATFDNIEKNRPYVVCLNDDFPSATPDWAFELIQTRLERLFPEKASFEY